MLSFPSSVHDTRHLPGIWMSSGPNDEGHIELTCQVGDLKISIKGPAEKATEFLRKVLALESDQRADSPAASLGSFDLVSSRPPEPSAFFA